MKISNPDDIDESVDVEQQSPVLFDGDGNDLNMISDQASKNRSKRKPSKTQIKHIAPKEENCDTSKYGTQNMEDLFNDVTQGFMYQEPVCKSSSPSMQHEVHNSQSLTPLTMLSPVQGAQLATTPSMQLKRERAFEVSGSSPGKSSFKSPPSYPCGICGKVFRVPSRYDSHMLGHSKGKPFCCNVCGKMFASQLKLDQHMPVHSCDRKSSFTCESCGKVTDITTLHKNMF